MNTLLQRDLDHTDWQIKHVTIGNSLFSRTLNGVSFLKAQEDDYGLNIYFKVPASKKYPCGEMGYSYPIWQLYCLLSGCKVTSKVSDFVNSSLHSELLPEHLPAFYDNQND
jgi:hypothetical protein